MKSVTLSIRLLFLLSVALTAGLPVAAKEVATLPARDFVDSQNGVTAADLVARALASNPTLAAARQEIEIANGGVAQAGLRKNPSLSRGGLKGGNGADSRFRI